MNENLQKHFDNMHQQSVRPSHISDYGPFLIVGSRIALKYPRLQGLTRRSECSKCAKYFLSSGTGNSHHRYCTAFALHLQFNCTAFALHLHCICTSIALHLRCNVRQCTLLNFGQLPFSLSPLLTP